MTTCKHCGEELDGLMAHARHSCNPLVLENMSDGEIRQSFIEMGMPTMGFEALGFAPPTEMERVIFEEPKKEEPIHLFVGSKMFEQFKNIL